MILFVGLGNPSPDNENNRHNIGFKIIDAINRKFSLSKQKPKFKGLLTTGNIGNKKVGKLVKFRKQSPKFLLGNRCFYVGQSAKKPSIRFKQHKDR